MHCTQCRVRNCALGKDISTCADCADYPCTDKLEALWNQLGIPHAKENLEKLRN